jgi:hypothetical protein
LISYRPIMKDNHETYFFTYCIAKESSNSGFFF